jgi:hypothetical protein
VIERAPDLKLLDKYGQKFDKIETQFFGSISYLGITYINTKTTTNTIK